MPAPVQKSRLIQTSELEKNASSIHQIEQSCFTNAWSISQILNSLNSPGCALLILTGDQQILSALDCSIPEGCDIIAYALLNFTDEESGEILRIATRPGIQRTGAASRLLQFIQNDFLVQKLYPDHKAPTDNQSTSTDTGRIRLLLEVAADNQAALALYQKFGFIKIHTRREYYGDVDALVLEWQRKLL